MNAYRRFFSWAAGLAMACALGVGGAGRASEGAGAAAQTPPNAAPLVGRALTPNRLDGRPLSQLGLGPWVYWNLENPFLDLTKLTAPAWTARASAEASLSYADLWAGGFINKVTHLPSAIPPGYDYLWFGLFRFGATVGREAEFAGDYVVEWDGDADIRFGFGMYRFQRQISPNRIEVTFAADDPNFSSIEATRIGGAGIRNLRIFRKENEALIRADRILDPRFAAHARRYKILRTEAIQNASDARAFRKGDFAKKAQASWSPDWRRQPATADMPNAIALRVLFDMAVESETALWTHVAGLPGAPAAFDALGGASDPALWRDACRTHLASILASSDWAAYFDALAAGAAQSGYPRSRTIFVEPWNEVWNFAYPWARMTQCAVGVAEAKGFPGGFVGQRWGYGYLAAHSVSELDKAFRRTNRRQAWKLILAGQNAWTETTRSALEGFKAYFAERGVDPGPWLKVVGVSTGTYYAGAFDRSVDGFLPAATEAAHVARWKSEIAADPVGLMKRRADWTINTVFANNTIPYVVGKRAEHKAIAEAYGATFLGDYEGESSDLLPYYLMAEPEIVNWAEAFIESAEGERVTRAWIQAEIDQIPNAVVANFQSIGVRDPEGDSPADARFEAPWIDGYYGEVTGRTRGLELMLRP